MEELEVVGLEGWGDGGGGARAEHGGEGAELEAECLDCVRVGGGGGHFLVVRSVHEAGVCSRCENSVNRRREARKTGGGLDVVLPLTGFSFLPEMKSIERDSVAAAGDFTTTAVIKCFPSFRRDVT